MEYTFAELHFHTKESSGCAEVSAYDAIPQYKENGYDLICVTDHFNRNHFWDHYYEGLTWEEAVDGWFAGWHAAKKAGEVHGITVLHGAEFKFDGVPNDYLVFGVTDEMYYEIPYMFTWTPVFRICKKKQYLFRSGSSIQTKSDTNRAHRTD